MSRINLQLPNEHNELTGRSNMPGCHGNFRILSIHLTVVAAGLLVVACSNDSGLPDNPVDTGTDVMTDATADTGPTPCEDAPTARLSATMDPTASTPKPRQNHTLQVTPISDITLSSEGSLARDGHSIDRVQWNIEKRPKFAVATFGFRRLRRGNERPLLMDTNDPDPTLQVGLTGEYKVRLDVWNEQGVRSCNTAELTVDVRPTSELYVEFKYPYEKVESSTEDQHLYRHPQEGPFLGFSVKRSADAAWGEDINDVIPNTRAQTNVQDWGKTGDESDDPEWVNVYDAAYTNSFVRLDGVESDVPYFAAVSVSRADAKATSRSIFKVYVNGERRARDSRLLGENYDVPFGLEILQIEKSDGSFEVQTISTLYYNSE